MKYIENKINWLIGPSGSGKTTFLLKIANGNNQAALIFQNPLDIINPYLPVYKQFKQIAIKHNTDANTIIEQLGINQIANYETKYYFQLSGGEKQRFVISFALATKRKIILGDEIISSLDYETSIMILKLLRKLVQHEKLTLILTAHEKNFINDDEIVWEYNDQNNQFILSK